MNNVFLVLVLLALLSACGDSKQLSEEQLVEGERLAQMWLEQCHKNFDCRNAIISLQDGTLLRVTYPGAGGLVSSGTITGSMMDKWAGNPEVMARRVEHITLFEDDEHDALFAKWGQKNLY